MHMCSLVIERDALMMLIMLPPAIEFIGHIQDITVYLSHKPDTQVNGANRQNIPVVKNGSFMRNKRHVFCVRTFTDSKNALLGMCPEL